MAFGKRATGQRSALRVVEAWTTGYPSQPVVGESHRIPDLRRIAGRMGGGPEGEAETTAVLVPEPDNKFDPNAVSVAIDGTTVGYLPREDAVSYSPTLLRLATAGVAVSVPARVWWGPLGDSNWMASVQLDLGPPGLLIPVNAPPAGSALQLPPGKAMQVTGEDEHLDVLAPLVSGVGQIAAIATLHEVTEQKARSSKQVLEVRIDDKAVGRLSPGMSEHLLAAVREAERRAVTLCVRASVKGNALKAEVTIYPTRAAELPQAWIDELAALGEIDRSARDREKSFEDVVRAEPATQPQAAMPPPNWYPNPAGPGLRWWDGTAWTEHTHDQ
jgi:collagen type III alpha